MAYGRERNCAWAGVVCGVEQVLLLGATGQIGRFVQRQWQEGEGRLCCAGRHGGEEVVRLDLYRDRLPQAGAILSTGPLDGLVQALERSRLPGLRRVVAFSSTSIIGKRQSLAASERSLAQRLEASERRLQQWCDAQAVEWVLLRPTLVYGGANRNVNRVAHWLDRYRMVPYQWPATGLRQPVHAADLAWLARRVLWLPEAAQQCWTLCGGETLSYRAMLERVRQAVGRGWLVPLPAALVAALTVKRPEIRAAFQRQQQDLCFDDRQARAVLGWRPGDFRPERTALLERPS